MSLRLVSKITALVVVALVATGFLVGARTDRTTHLTLQFADTTGLYVGNNVEVIGVRVGKVTAIEPRGTRADVTIEVDDEIPLSADAGAIIMQSSLVTDRFVELTPPWTKGDRLAEGDVIPLERTHSPANFDDVLAAVDDLVVALKDTTDDGKDVGDLLQVGAEQLDGKGRKVADALEAASGALGTIDGKEDDVTAIVDDLASLTAMLEERDETVRTLSETVTDSTAMLSDQREDLASTLETLQSLTATVTSFVEDNHELVSTNLAQAADVLTIFAENSDSLAETFDTFPAMAENLTRAFDTETRRTRIRVDIRNTGPFATVARHDLCTTFLFVTGDLCDTLFSPEGTGLLDPLLDGVTDLFPGDL
jgi:phospholipid/cholesterol/gamma-HCH transport system substrate-binding protein